jgi:4-carboxymuconolactone decarboxylase
MSRITHKAYDDLNDEQQALYNQLTETRKASDDGVIGGPFDVWMQNADLGKQIVGLGGTFRFGTSVDRRYIELVILMTGQFWQAQFEWYAHEPMAVKAGVPQNLIDAIKAGNKPDFESKEDRIVYELCTELHHNHQVSDSVFAEMTTHFGEQGVMELVNLAGYYTMVSMTLNTFRVPFPEGASYPFPQI